MINTHEPLTLLGGLSPQSFLNEYWQKKPLLVRQAIPDLQSPVSAEELAGMALEPDVNARLIEERHHDEPWHVTYSPLPDDSFSRLPESHWTFLLTDCEKHWPSLRSLIEPFAFIPDWRRDDLMISYAADQGSVGPHTDEYDVFLLQLEGNRHWHIGHEIPVGRARCIPDLELSILQRFESVEDWVLQPGDMLYLPPNIPHHGVAEGPCMTASIGFRAPAQNELMQGFLDECLDKLEVPRRYSDPQLQAPSHPAEIPATAMNELFALMAEGLQLHEVERNDWLGRFLTEPPGDHDDSTLSRGEFLTALNEPDTVIQRTSFSRMNYSRHLQTLTLFANGHSWKLSHLMIDDVQQLCQQTPFPLASLTTHSSSQTRELLYELHQAYVIELH
ncbi:MAG: JmjC domain-containing protein [bacterium]